MRTRMTITRVGKILATCLTACTMVLTCAACGNQETKASKKPAKQTINVVATIDTWASIARQIGGNDIQVNTILSGSNVKTSSVELDKKQAQMLQTANIAITNGAGYDSWADQYLPKKGELVKAASTVGAVDGDNPYLWFSHDARLAMANAITEAFMRVKPSKKQAFSKRLDAWKRQEQQLQDAVKAYSEELRDTKYATTSPILSYLLSDLAMSDNTPKDYHPELLENDTNDTKASDMSSEDSADTDSATNQNKQSDNGPRIDSFQKLLENRKIDVLINNSQRTSDIINTLIGIAGRSYISNVNVSELMPSYASNLDQWIKKICDDLKNAITMTQSIRKELDKDATHDDQLSTKAPVEKKPTVVTPKKPRSNAGQQDPGK